MPQKEPVVRLDKKPNSQHVPLYVMRGAWLGRVCEEMLMVDAEVVISDFGESWQPAQHTRYELHTPLLYRAPEALPAKKEGQPVGFPADVWSMACTIYELFSSDQLFQHFRPDDHDAFAEAVSLLGKPPARWWDIWEARGEFFNEAGEWDLKFRGRDPEYKPLKLRMSYISEDRQRNENMITEELEDLTCLLKQMLRWLPEDRATAEELAASHWMRKWGYPALESLERMKRGE